MPKLVHKDKVLPRTHRDPATLGDFKLHPSHRAMLELLFEYRYATPELLGLAYSARRGRGMSQVQHELGRLWHAGYVERFYYSDRPSGYGSGPHVYTLRLDGAREILDKTDYSTFRQQVANRNRPKSNVPHCLAISTLQFILTQGSSSPKLAEFSADQERQDTRVKVDLPGSKEPGIVWPDATAVFEWPNGGRSLFLFEIERSHKNRQRRLRRFLTYGIYLTDHIEAIKYENDVSGVVAVFIADTAENAALLQDQAVEAIGDLGRSKRPILLFSSMEHWYERVTARDSRSPNKQALRQALADPQKVLARKIYATLDGKLRPLFLSA